MYGTNLHGVAGGRARVEREEHGVGGGVADDTAGRLAERQGEPEEEPSGVRVEVLGCRVQGVGCRV